MVDEASNLKTRHFVKIILACLGIITFALTLILFGQVHHLRKNLKAQTDTITTLNTQISNLSDSNATLNNTLNTIQASTNLKQIQAASANLALTELQTNLLQGADKTVLLNNFNSVQLLVNSLHSSTASNAANQLEHALNALPDVNPAQAISQLSVLAPALANLTFVSSIPANPALPAANTQRDFAGSLKAIWQELKSLVIVRTDNTISAQLVSDAARFDALRQINLLIQQAKWQILTMQDPTDTLTQLKINVSAYTEASPAQTAWLNQVTQIQTGNNYYTNAEISLVLKAINNLQDSLSL